MIPLEHKSNIIQSGISFMLSITEAYGADEGMKLWDIIASTLDPDVKGEIFFAMLTGDHTGQACIHVTSFDRTSDRIKRIKAIRIVTGLGLREAKDLSDSLDSGNSIELNVDLKRRNWALNELRSTGFQV